MPGVVSTTSGYTGGNVPNPTYEQVSAHHTGHAEAVMVVFDPKQVSYRQLVEHYWRTIDPTTKDRQFCDAGSPYRTAIFVAERRAAEARRGLESRARETKPFKEPIVTEVVPAAAFYPAEEYHQDYYKKNPLRYKFYKYTCGRAQRLEELWGS